MQPKIFQLWFCYMETFWRFCGKGFFQIVPWKYGISLKSLAPSPPGRRQPNFNVFTSRPASLEMALRCHSQKSCLTKVICFIKMWRVRASDPHFLGSCQLGFLWFSVLGSSTDQSHLWVWCVEEPDPDANVVAPWLELIHLNLQDDAAYSLDRLEWVVSWWW